MYLENSHGQIIKKIHKKRPGTLGICGLIQNKFGIDAVAHVLCQGFSKEETEDLLIELSYMGISNVLALKGDNLNYNKNISKEKSANNYSSELVSQINSIKNGKFLDSTDYTPMDFCIGVAGYPEKHSEAPNLDIDIMYLKQKIDAGAEYIITQMFFDNQKFFAFVNKCREAGINVPIIPGIKVLKNVKQLQGLPKLFNIDIPNELANQLLENPQHAGEIGKRWAKQQVQELLIMGIPCVHFFLMNDATSVLDIIKTV
jgi:methylenetetrahydrofolate reductase (NADPH)